MDLHHAWSVSLVVLTVLTLVLVVATLILVTCLRSENKMFYKRFRKNVNKNENKDDLCNFLQSLKASGLNFNGTLKLDWMNLIDQKEIQLQQNELSESRIQRKILEIIR